MEHATACTLPEGNREEMKLAYEQASGEDLLTFSRLQFCYWTQDRFASAFRRMLTVEQYHNEEMQQLYQQYLGAGPLQYVADFLGSEDDALAFYGPMHLLYSVYDQPGQTQYAMRLLDVHLARWKMRLNGKGK